MRHLMLRGAAMVAVLALLAPAAAAPAAEAASTPKSSGIVGVININTASAEQLELLPGVGPARARAIVEHRSAQGAFKRPEDLTQVKGIGERAFERLRPHVATSGKTTARPAP